MSSIKNAYNFNGQMPSRKPIVEKPINRRQQMIRPNVNKKVIRPNIHHTNNVNRRPTPVNRRLRNRYLQELNTVVDTDRKMTNVNLIISGVLLVILIVLITKYLSKK